MHKFEAIGSLRRAAIAVLAFLALASTVAAAENREAVAVIIGNKAYTGDTPEVTYAHNDAEAMKRYVIDVLGYREGNIIDLRDATKGQFESVFGSAGNHRGQLFNWVRPERSDVTVFYSGHGVPGLQDRRGYLLPVDADPNFAELAGYPLDTLYANLAKIDARSMSVFLDACFSGDSAAGMLIRATSGIGISPRLPDGAAQMTILTAATAEQVASWDEEAGNGLFTENLLAALYGAADSGEYGDGDGRVTVAEVRTYLGDEMTYRARRTYGRDQTASITGGDGIVLVVFSPGELPRRPRLVLPKESGDTPPSRTGRQDARRAEEVAFWNSIAGSESRGDYEAYLDIYPSGIYATLALNRIEEIANRRVAALPPPVSRSLPDLTAGALLAFSNGSYQIDRILADRIEVRRDRKREELLLGIIRVGREVLQKDHELSVTSREMRKLTALFPLRVGSTTKFRMRDVYDGNDHIDNIKVELRVVGQSTFVTGSWRIPVYDLRGEFRISAPGAGNAAKIIRTYKYSPDLGVVVDFTETSDNQGGWLSHLLGSHFLQDIKPSAG